MKETHYLDARICLNILFLIASHLCLTIRAVVEQYEQTVHTIQNTPHPYQYAQEPIAPSSP